jgi:hypothetical protein
MYSKGSTNSYHAKIKKAWARAEKKRRTKRAREVRDVANRLLGISSPAIPELWYKDN